jgi:hypothetical protein
MNQGARKDDGENPRCVVRQLCLTGTVYYVAKSIAVSVDVKFRQSRPQTTAGAAYNWTHFGLVLFLHHTPYAAQFRDVEFSLKLYSICRSFDYSEFSEFQMLRLRTDKQTDGKSKTLCETDCPAGPVTSTFHHDDCK